MDNELPNIKDNKEVMLLLEQLYAALNFHYKDKAKFMKIEILMDNKPLPLDLVDELHEGHLNFINDKLVYKLCKIPLYEWDSYDMTKFNGKTVCLCQHQGNYWFEIDSVKFFDHKDTDGHSMVNTYGSALYYYKLTVADREVNIKKKDLINELLNL